jgi:hypothetical protein
MSHETYKRVRTVKHLSGAFPIKNILKEVGALAPFLFNFALHCAIWGCGKPEGLEIEWYTSASGLR